MKLDGWDLEVDFTGGTTLRKGHFKLRYSLDCNNRMFYSVEHKIDRRLNRDKRDVSAISVHEEIRQIEKEFDSVHDHYGTYYLRDYRIEEEKENMFSIHNSKNEPLYQTFESLDAAVDFIRDELDK